MIARILRKFPAQRLTRLVHEEAAAAEAAPKMFGVCARFETSYVGQASQRGVGDSRLRLYGRWYCYGRCWSLGAEEHQHRELGER